MATVLLQYAGAAIGGALGGPVGAILGRTAGAIAGSMVDQRLFGRGIAGPRLDDLRVTASTEGSPIPAVFGLARVAGQLIWAKPLEEVTRQQRGGGKGGPSVSEHSYFASLALGLAEGPVARIVRVWADGKELPLDDLTVRFYPGTEDQEPDSLIAAHEGGVAPAYRGLSYAVFERLPLTPFSNRIPQLSFEIERPLGALTEMTRAVAIIPGSTEFGYDTRPVRRATGPGRSASENAHASPARSDWSVSLDHLTALCPKTERASLIVAWFGDSLDAGTCILKPGVDAPVKDTWPSVWSVAGLTRGNAHQVSRIAGRAAFGGTPCDASVVRALQDMRARGLKPMFYPFILMDMPGFPWRGRITSAGDGTSVAARDAARFIGSVTAADFVVDSTGVRYRGAAESSLSRMVLHYAALCAFAGGVDSFLIGSELPGITQLRDKPGSYPAAAMLARLAREVKRLLPTATVSYAADWSEYGAHRPALALDDLGFPLDGLWAEAAIDAVSIDNYMPLSDWRDGEGHADWRAGWRSIHDPAYLRANVTGGEYHDWFYASPADRALQKRTAITDGFGKPWVWRAKDLVGWWSNPHLPRTQGRETAATGWVPQSKPIWFTELGCPAVDKGSNEPNKFPDAKSREAGLPFASSGRRDDLIQRRYLEVMLRAWAEPARNPVSRVYGKPMVDRARIYLWTWDARPYPWFPALGDVWSDAANYANGHWLNGRVGQPGIDDLIAAILGHFDVDAVDVSRAGGVPVPGYVIDRPMSARDALEPLISAFAITVRERGAGLSFTAGEFAEAITLTPDACVEKDAAKPLMELKRADPAGLPQAMRIGFADLARAHRTSAVEVRLPDAPAGGQDGALSLAATMNEAQARALAAAHLAASRTARASLSLCQPASRLALEPGDLIILPPEGTRPQQQFRITALRGGLAREVEAVAVEPGLFSDLGGEGRALAAEATSPAAPPFALMLDLPMLPGGRSGPFVAASAEPWPGPLALYKRSGPASFAPDGTVTSPAIMGLTQTVLAAGPLARRDHANSLTVELTRGSLQSVSDLELLNGANLAAIGSMEAGFELIQFGTARLIGNRIWRVSGLLRGLLGSAADMRTARAAGAAFVLIDQSLVVPDSAAFLAGAFTGEWRVGPQARDLGDESFVSLAFQSRARAARPLAPCQLRIARVAAGLALSWQRQTRLDGDAWEQMEVPLGESAEAYGLSIIGADGRVRRSLTLDRRAYLYSAADILADFGGAMPRRLTLRLTQIAPAFGPGAVYEDTRDV